jgi:hypothetical protein
MTEVATTHAPKPPVALSGPLANLDEAWRMAQALAQSALMPDSLRNKPSDVLVTVLYGREIGLAPMQALQTIHVIKGRPFISGQLWLSLVRRAGHRAEVSGDGASATCTITRGDTDEQHSETFTLEQAKTAKLTGNADSNWSKYPDRMLRWRAVANCARMICPEVALGFEAEEERGAEQPQRPSLAQVAAERTPAAEADVHEAEVVDDAEVRAQVEQLQRRHTEPRVDKVTGEVFEPTEEDIAALNAEAAADAPDTEAPTGLFGSQ